MDTDSVLRYHDYFFTEEGCILRNFGIEGQGFNFKENGMPMLADVVTNNPDGFNQMQMKCLYAMPHNTAVGFYEWDSTRAAASNEYVSEAYSTWDNDWDGTAQPILTALQEDSGDYSTRIGDIQTYVEEWSTRAISGIHEINDSTWNEYIQTLKGMGVDICQGYMQKSLDKYYDKDITVGYSAEQVAEFGIGNGEAFRQNFDELYK